MIRAWRLVYLPSAWDPDPAPGVVLVAREKGAVVARMARLRAYHPDVTYRIDRVIVPRSRTWDAPMRLRARAVTRSRAMF